MGLLCDCLTSQMDRYTALIFVETNSSNNPKSNGQIAEISPRLRQDPFISFGQKILSIIITQNVK